MTKKDNLVPNPEIRSNLKITVTIAGVKIGNVTYDKNMVLRLK